MPILPVLRLDGAANGTAGPGVVSSADDPEKEHALYAAAVDVLVHLHRHPVPEGVAAMDAARLCDLAALPWTTYAPGDPAGMIRALNALLSETSGLTV